MNINNKICEILIKQKNIFSKEEIMEILNLLIEEEKLEDYVQKITFDMSENNSGSYIRKNKLININYNMIKNNLKYTKFKDSILGKNIVILSTIFHEIEHVKQYKYIETTETNTIEKERLTIEIINGLDEMLKRYEVLNCQIGFISISKYINNLYIFNKIKRYYTSNIGYYSKLAEKQAEIKSLEKCQELLKIISNKEAKIINNEIEKEKNINLLKGYKNLILLINYPYKYFEKNLKYISDKDNRILNINSNELSLEERMMYGYPITKQEYNKIKNKRFL